MKPTLLLIIGMLFFASGAKAQVIINQAALDQLAGIAPPVVTAPPVVRHRPRKISYRPAIRRIRRSGPLALRPVVARPAPLPAAPKPAVQPVVARPVAPLPAPPKPPAPVMVVFAPGDASLPGNITTLLKPLCAHGGIVTIDAYAVADPADPSQAARLSMSRAFAIRDALTACGVASGNVIPRANGSARTAHPDAATVTPSP